MGSAYSQPDYRKDPVIGGGWKNDSPLSRRFAKTFTLVTWDGIQMKEDILNSVISWAFEQFGGNSNYKDYGIGCLLLTASDLLPRKYGSLRYVK